MFLEECKYVIKEKKISRYIIDDAEISSDSDEETLLEKNQMKKNSDYQASSGEEILEKIQMEKISDEENCGKKIFFSIYIKNGKSILSKTRRKTQKKKKKKRNQNHSEEEKDKRRKKV